MRKHRDILDNPSTRDKIGNLYEGLQVTTINKIPLQIEYYSLMFFLKRAIFVMITFSLYNYPGLQVMAFLQLTIFYLIYIGSVDFFKKKKKQYISVANEFIAINALYFYLMLVNIVSDSLQRTRIGFAILGATAGIIILNFVFLIFTLCKVLKRKYNKFIHKQKVKKH